jgi:DNA-binding protein HU-beta
VKKEVKEMTKAEVITTISKEANISKASAEKAINAFTASVTKALKRGDKLSLTGFGTFSVAKRKARMGRNPQTGKEIKYSCQPRCQIQTRQSFKRRIEVAHPKSITRKRNNTSKMISRGQKWGGKPSHFCHRY